MPHGLQAPAKCALKKPHPCNNLVSYDRKDLISGRRELLARIGKGLTPEGVSYSSEHRISAESVCAE
jgi:hypothetical protein